MATWKPELHSPDAVLSYYDEYDNPCYRVFAGHKPDANFVRFLYDGTEKGIGREKLVEALNSILSNPDNTNVYLIEILASKGKKMECLNSITFQLNKKEQFLPYNPMMNQMVQPNFSNELNALRSEISALKMQLDEDENEDEDEEPEENFLSGIMKNPQIQNMILQQLAGLLNPMKVTNVAGVIEKTNVDQESKIDEAIEILMQYDDQLGDDLLLLSEMAKNDQMQFNFLIKMLRK
jgi:hypothetical protein